MLKLFTSKVWQAFVQHIQAQAPMGKCHRPQEMTFFISQAYKQNNVTITEDSEVLSPLQHLSLFSVDDLRTRWSKGIKEFEATVRKSSCLTLICRTDRIRWKISHGISEYLLRSGETTEKWAHALGHLFWLSEEWASRHAASDLWSQTGHPGTSGNVKYTGEQGRIPGFCTYFRLSIYVRYFSYLLLLFIVLFVCLGPRRIPLRFNKSEISLLTKRNLICC